MTTIRKTTGTKNLDLSCPCGDECYCPRPCNCQAGDYAKR